MSRGRNDVPAKSSLFDTWLQTGLQRLYDETLDEPVPDDLLTLLPDTSEPGRS